VCHCKVVASLVQFVLPFVAAAVSVYASQELKRLERKHAKREVALQKEAAAVQERLSESERCKAELMQRLAEAESRAETAAALHKSEAGPCVCPSCPLLPPPAPPIPTCHWLCCRHTCFSVCLLATPPNPIEVLTECTEIA
jgi:hypothetical protein